MTTIKFLSYARSWSLSAACSAALAVQSHAAFAQPVDPTVDEFPVYDDATVARTYLLKLRFNERFDVALESLELGTQLARGRSAAPPLLRLETRSLDATVLDSFNSWHPLWKFQIDASGQEHMTLTTNRVGRFVVPFKPHAAEIVVYDVAASNTEVARVDLLPTTHEFCRAAPSDPACTALPNRTPTCNAGGAYSAECTATATNIMFNGSGSSDIDLDPLTFSWSGAFAPNPASGVSPTVGFTGVGSFPVQLQVSDGLGSSTCAATASVVDTIAPIVSASPVSVNRCTEQPTQVAVSASATDQCNATGVLAVSGQLTSIAAKPVSPPIALGNSPGSVVLPPGTSTVQWAATDPSTNSTTVNQSVTVNVTENAGACCPPGSMVVQGGSGFDLIVRAFSNAYCVFGNGGNDNVLTAGGVDFIAGGAGGDVIDSGASTGDIVSGGAGDDWLNINLGSQTTLYGGADNDTIDQNSPGTIFGNAGNDHIETLAGAHTIYPGPGRDTVHGGAGDDTVVIRHVCEVVSGELLDGGLGNDTLITPVPVAELQSRGALLLGFQNIIVSTAEQHLSECF